MTLPEYLQHLEKLDSEAANAPWWLDESKCDYLIIRFPHAVRKKGYSNVCIGFMGHKRNPQHLSSFKFIAESRTAIPKLVKMVRELIDCSDKIYAIEQCKKFLEEP